MQAPAVGAKYLGRCLAVDGQILMTSPGLLARALQNRGGMETNSIKLTALFAILLGALVFSGCRTMEGAGKDIENAGENIQDAAK